MEKPELPEQFRGLFITEQWDKVKVVFKRQEKKQTLQCVGPFLFFCDHKNLHTINQILFIPNCICKIDPKNANKHLIFESLTGMIDPVRIIFDSTDEFQKCHAFFDKIFSKVLNYHKEMNLSTFQLSAKLEEILSPKETKPVMAVLQIISNNHNFQALPLSGSTLTKPFTLKMTTSTFVFPRIMQLKTKTTNNYMFSMCEITSKKGEEHTFSCHSLLDMMQWVLAIYITSHSPPLQRKKKEETSVIIKPTTQPKIDNSNEKEVKQEKKEEKTFEKDEKVQSTEKLDEKKDEKEKKIENPNENLKEKTTSDKEKITSKEHSENVDKSSENEQNVVSKESKETSENEKEKEKTKTKNGLFRKKKQENEEESKETKQKRRKQLFQTKTKQEEEKTNHQEENNSTEQTQIEKENEKETEERAQQLEKLKDLKIEIEIGDSENKILIQEQKKEEISAEEQNDEKQSDKSQEEMQNNEKQDDKEKTPKEKPRQRMKLTITSKSKENLTIDGNTQNPPEEEPHKAKKSSRRQSLNQQKEDSNDLVKHRESDINERATRDIPAEVKIASYDSLPLEQQFNQFKTQVSTFYKPKQVPENEMKEPILLFSTPFSFDGFVKSEATKKQDLIKFDDTFINDSIDRTINLFDQNKEPSVEPEVFSFCDNIEEFLTSEDLINDTISSMSGTTTMNLSEFFDFSPFNIDYDNDFNSEAPTCPIVTALSHVCEYFFGTGKTTHTDGPMTNKFLFLICSIFLNGFKKEMIFADAIENLSHSVPEIVPIAQKLPTITDNMNSQCSYLVSKLVVDNDIQSVLRAILRIDFWAEKYYERTAMILNDEALEEALTIIDTILNSHSFEISISTNLVQMSLSETISQFATQQQSSAQGDLRADKVRFIDTPIYAYLESQELTKSNDPITIIKKMFYAGIKHKTNFLQQTVAIEPFDFIIEIANKINNSTEIAKEFIEIVRKLQSQSSSILSTVTMSNNSMIKLEQWIEEGLKLKHLHLWLCLIVSQHQIAAEFYNEEGVLYDFFRAKFFISQVYLMIKGK